MTYSAYTNVPDLSTRRANFESLVVDHVTVKSPQVVNGLPMRPGDRHYVLNALPEDMHQSDIMLTPVELVGKAATGILSLQTAAGKTSAVRQHAAAPKTFAGFCPLNIMVDALSQSFVTKRHSDYSFKDRPFRHQGIDEDGNSIWKTLSIPAPARWWGTGDGTRNFSWSGWAAEGRLLDWGVCDEVWQVATAAIDRYADSVSWDRMVYTIGNRAVNGWLMESGLDVPRLAALKAALWLGHCDRPIVTIIVRPRPGHYQAVLTPKIDEWQVALDRQVAAHKPGDPAIAVFCGKKATAEAEAERVRGEHPDLVVRVYSSETPEENAALARDPDQEIEAVDVAFFTPVACTSLDIQTPVTKVFVCHDNQEISLDLVFQMAPRFRNPLDRDVVVYFPQTSQNWVNADRKAVNADWVLGKPTLVEWKHGRTTDPVTEESRPASEGLWHIWWRIEEETRLSRKNPRAYFCERAEAHGWTVVDATATATAEDINTAKKTRSAARKRVTAKATALFREQKLLAPKEAAKLARQPKKSKAEKAQLAMHQVCSFYGVTTDQRADDMTPESVDAVRRYSAVVGGRDTALGNTLTKALDRCQEFGEDPKSLHEVLEAAGIALDGISELRGVADTRSLGTLVRGLGGVWTKTRRETRSEARQAGREERYWVYSADFTRARELLTISTAAMSNAA